MDPGLFTSRDLQVFGNIYQSVAFHAFIFLFIGTLYPPVETLPKLSSSNISRVYEPVAKDLEKLSTWFQHCHIHLILAGHDMTLHLISHPLAQWCQTGAPGAKSGPSGSGNWPAQDFLI